MRKEEWKKEEEEQEEEYEICKISCFTHSHILTSDFALIEQNLFAAHTKQRLIVCSAFAPSLYFFLSHAFCILDWTCAHEILR